MNVAGALRWLSVALIAMSGMARGQNQPLQIVYPNGGETFYIGDTVTVKFSMAAGATSTGAGLDIVEGKYRWLIVQSNINPAVDSTREWVIPATMSKQLWSDSANDFITAQISLVSDSCQMEIYEYNKPNEIYDLSDGFFAIRPASEKPNSSVLNDSGDFHTGEPTSENPSPAESKKGCGGGCILAFIVPLGLKAARLKRARARST